MKHTFTVFTAVLALGAIVLAGCGAPTPTVVPPTVVPTATVAPSPTSKAAASDVLTPQPGIAVKAGTVGFEVKSSSGGSVVVDVKPTALAPGKPAEFDVAMNTHSVDLSDDMVKIAVLRDDKGKEYKPTAWDGPGGGGHHREGRLKFPALAGEPKYVELVLTGIAKVPERTFRWELP